MPSNFNVLRRHIVLVGFQQAVGGFLAALLTRAGALESRIKVQQQHPRQQQQQ
jgi:hypothetical protein